MDIKKCQTCKKEKPLSDFDRNISRVDGYQHRCKECRSIHYKKDYLKHKEFYLSRNNDRRNRWREFIGSLKKECIKCGETHPWCLEFHHKEEKNISISIIYSKLSFSEKNKKVVLRELELCDVLCSNCHRKQHYSERSSAE